MKTKSRKLLFAVMGMILLTSACNGAAPGTPTSAVSGSATPAVNGSATPAVTEALTATPAESTATATAAGTTATPTPGGTQNAPLLVEVCGFCVDTVSQVVLTAPEDATFEVEMLSAQATPLPAPGITCNNVETVNDKQVVLCSGPQNISFRLKLCQGNNCSETQVNLPACPLTMPGSTATATGTASATVSPTPTAGMTATPTPAAGTATATAAAGSATPTLTPTP